MKKNTRGEPIRFIIHIHMEISQGNSLFGYLYLKQAKIHFFLFSSTKSENRKAEGVVLVGTSERRQVAGKGGRRVNMV
jgi:hypothetical protein